MSLVHGRDGYHFNLDEVHVGDCFYAKKYEWPEGKRGIISYVSEDSLTCVFHPEVANVYMHFFLKAQEVGEGLWEEVRWSSDLITVYSDMVEEIDPDHTDAKDEDIQWIIDGLYQ